MKLYQKTLGHDFSNRFYRLRKKLTTLYTILKLLNKSGVNITTIEDPIEYDMDGVNQIQS